MEETMELTQEEKERILAEERVRFDAKKQILEEQAHARCGHGRGCGCGCCRHGGFLKGLILGVLLTALAGFLACHFGYCHSQCTFGKACYGPTSYECPSVKSWDHHDRAHWGAMEKDETGSK
jgi:hypothetical protein